MTRWRVLASDGLLIAAMVIPATLCAAPLVAPSIVDRPRYVALYIAPFALGFLLWCRRRLLDARLSLGPRLALDALAVGLSALRLAGPVVPMSGHMLFFVYTLLTTPSPIYRLVTLALIAETSYIKILVWHDRTSWAYGVLAGLVLGAVYLASARIVGPRRAPRPTESP